MSEPKQAHEAPVTLSCAICRDLLPLVQDGVASPESEAAVRAHLQCCPACKALWPEVGRTPEPAPLPDDEQVVRRLRARVNGWLVLFIAAGLLLGLACSRSNLASGVLFVLIFPLVSGLTYWWGGRVWRALPPLAALLWAGYYLTGGQAAFAVRSSWLIVSLGGAVAAAVLCLIGVAAAALFRYAWGGKRK